MIATDAQDKFFAASNRGGYIAGAAPGVDILVAAPSGAYQIQSGTSFSAAEVSGIAALMIERRPHLTPNAIRAILCHCQGARAGGKEQRIQPASS